jgi:hypothetical protein
VVDLSLRSSQAVLLELISDDGSGFNSRVQNLRRQQISVLKPDSGGTILQVYKDPTVRIRDGGRSFKTGIGLRLARRQRNRQRRH